MNQQRFKIFLFRALLISLFAICSLGVSSAIAGDAKPLPVDKAFKLTATIGPDQTVKATWTIAPHYHLYKKRFHFNVLSPKNLELGRILMPAGRTETNNILGRHQVYEHALTLFVPVLTPKATPIQLQIDYQGCAGASFCYPMVSKTVAVNFARNQISVLPSDQGPDSASAAGNLGHIHQLLAGGHWFWIILGFMGFGALLCFTPCVLPMLPIIGGIVIGSRQRRWPSALLLALAYVLGMALAYALAGLFAALLGGSLQARLQSPWVIGAFSLVFVGLALSLFGFYELQLPRFIREPVDRLSHQQKSGSALSALIMGILSTLIVSPCVTPPLVGALTYIGNTGNVLLGALALFAFGIGMGLPLIAFILLGNKILPKAGAWMVTVKNIFGVLMLAVALWLLERIVPGPVSLVLWASLLIISSVYLGCFRTATRPWQRFGQGIAIILLIWGSLLLVGASQGASNPLQPLQGNLQLSPPSMTHKAGAFTLVTTKDEVNQQVKRSSQQGKITLLDFYADWCVSCKEMDQETFADPAVIKRLSSVNLLRIDVTQNTAQVQAVEKNFGVIAPPSIIFFDRDGKMLDNATIVGKIGPEALIAVINQISAKKS